MKPPDTELLTVLATKYPAPHWVFMREFRNATGFDAIRSADALAVGLYRSRGQVIIGFEKKIIRSDWLREMKRPDKAEPIAQFCDFFNLVVPGTKDGANDVAKPEELPEPWGLVVVDQVRKKIHTVKPAKQLQAAIITRPFFSAIVKQAMDAAQMPGKEALEEARQAGIQYAQDNLKHQIPYELERLRKLEETVKEFTKASGVELHEWSDGKQIGEAVRVLQSILGGNYSMFQNIQQAASGLALAVQELKTLTRPAENGAAA